MITRIQILFLLLFSTSFATFGQKVQSASFEYSHSALPSEIKYSEVYSITNSTIQHYSVSNRSGKKRLPKSPKITDAALFLDSILSAEYYIIEIDTVQLDKLLKDSTSQKRWEITTEDINQCLDSFNRIRFEKKFFDRRFKLPLDEKEEHNDSIITKICIKWYQLESAIIDGTPFELKFSVNSKVKMTFSSNLFQDTPRSNYATWFSIYLMQKKFRLFEKSSPINYFFENQALPGMIIMYTVWKKYGIS